MFGGGGTGKAEAPVELKAPSGTTPDAICRKVVYWVQRRRMLFDEARETLGDLMFSKTTDEVEQVCNATADGDLPKKTFLEALLENNAKLALNLTDRIVQNVYFGEVHDPKKSQKKAVEYARLLSTHDVLAVLLGFFEGLNFETRKAVEKLFSALIKQNYGDFITEYVPRPTLARAVVNETRRTRPLPCLEWSLKLRFAVFLILCCCATSFFRLRTAQVLLEQCGAHPRPNPARRLSRACRFLDGLGAHGVLRLDAAQLS